MAKKLGGQKRFTKTNVEKVPDRTGIYVIKSEGGQTQYVGVSQKMKTRLAQHLRQKDIPGAHAFQTRPLRSKKQAENLEGDYIKRHKPKYNILKKK